MKSNLIGVDSILELLFAYLKQYNIHFNYRSKHFKSVVQLFKIIMVAHSTQFLSYNYYLFYSNFISPCKNRIYG